MVENTEWRTGRGDGGVSGTLDEIETTTGQKVPGLLYTVFLIKYI
jgi:hypothetical protein